MVQPANKIIKIKKRESLWKGCCTSCAVSYPSVTWLHLFPRERQAEIVRLLVVCFFNVSLQPAGVEHVLSWCRGRITIKSCVCHSHKRMSSWADKASDVCFGDPGDRLFSCPKTPFFYLPLWRPSFRDSEHLEIGLIKSLISLIWGTWRGSSKFSTCWII